MKTPQHILFVCTGNICRSPMAEYLFRFRVGEDSGWTTSSAGVYAPSGSPASRPAVEALADWGIDLQPHRSRPLTLELVDDSRWVVVMTREHRDAILDALPHAADKVRLFTSFGTDRRVDDIADPIGCPVDVYRKVRDQFDGAIADLLLYLIETGELQPPTDSQKP